MKQRRRVRGVNSVWIIEDYRRPSACARWVRLFLVLAGYACAAGWGSDVAAATRVLSSSALTATISLDTGEIVGIADAGGQLYVTNSYDMYAIQTQTEGKRYFSEKDDVVQTIVTDTLDLLVLDCSNFNIPAVVIRKQFYFTGLGAEQRILCRKIQMTGSPAELTLCTSVSNVIFDPSFRSGAYYHCVFPQGVYGDVRPLIAAASITGGTTIPRYDHAGEEGRAACDAFNPGLGVGIGHYLYQANDQWIYPHSMEITYWNSQGWKMGSGSFFIGPEATTIETRYHLFSGDRLSFHFEYVNLPEYKAVRDDGSVLPKVHRINTNRADDVAMGYAKINTTPPGEHGWEWGVYANSDDVVLTRRDLTTGAVIQTETGLDLKQRWQSYRDATGVYIYRAYESDVTRAHPDWFIEPCDVLYYRPTLAHEVSDYRVAGLVSEADYLGTGDVYLDAALSDFPDWTHGIYWQSYDSMYFYRRLQEELHKIDNYLFLNMRTGSVYYDVGYYEVSGAHVQPGKTWRDGGDADMMYQIYKPKGTLMVPLYWWINGPSENNRRYQNLVLALGETERGGAWAYPDEHGELPVMANMSAFSESTMEYVQAEFVEIGLEPAWVWLGLKTPYLPTQESLPLESPANKLWRKE